MYITFLCQNDIKMFLHKMATHMDMLIWDWSQP